VARTPRVRRIALWAAIAAALIAALGFLVAPKSGAEGNKDKGKPTRADFALK
jgi:hypothetical protein